jgi:hypothetical protein
MSRIPSAVVAFVLLLFLSTPSANAAPVSITSGSLGGRTFDDLAFLINGNGITLFGAESFSPTLGAQLATGHLSRSIPTFGLNGVMVFPEIINMNFELSFTPITLLTLSPFDPGVAGSSVSEPFTMTGVLSGPNFPAIEFVGQGTITAGWFPKEGPDFGRQSVGAQFVPEPSSVALLAFGVIWLVVARKQFATRS